MTAVSSRNIFGFCSTILFWAILGAVLVSIPIRAFVADGTKVVHLKLILPQEGNFGQIEAVSSPAEIGINEKTEISQAYPAPENPVTDKSLPISETTSMETTSPVAKISPSKPISQPERPVTASVQSPVQSKPVAVTANVSPKAPVVTDGGENAPVTAPVPTAVATTNEVATELPVENSVLRTAEIQVFEDNGQIASLPQNEGIAPIDVEDQFSPGEITSAGLKFTGFFRNRGGKYALKSSSGDMRILSSPGIPKISSAELSAEKISVSFRVLPSGNVPLSGIGVQGCPSEDVANAVKVEISSWKFVASDESSFLNFSCEASQ
ncbi:MAG: hypothetical protein IIW10_01270 [Spirochaetaceae bacterium]|nr:hypothetical protein [Spirochaetaceae bacterium]